MTVDTGSDPPLRRQEMLLGLGVVLVYVVVRLVLLPGDADSTHMFGHDASYLAIVARNLVNGRGFVNDAHWLLFVHSDGIPVPYHNANPLFPLLVAGVAWITGNSVAFSGFLVTILASALLMVGIVFLCRRYVENVWLCILAGLAVVLFPPIFEPTSRYLTDGLYVAFFIAFLVMLVRVDRESRGLAYVSGIILGLGWLTRSATILIVPAAVAFLAMRLGWRRGMSQLIRLATGGIGVATPWFIRNWRVWGNPFRSDAPHYLFQDIYAQQVGGSLERFWHSIGAPVGPVQLITQEPGVVLSHWLKGIPAVTVHLFDSWATGSVWIGVLLGVSVILLLLRRHDDLWQEIAAIGIYCLTLIVVFAFRYDSVHSRYYITATVLFAILAAAGSWAVLSGLSRAFKRRSASLVGGTALGLLWFVYVPRSAVIRWQQLAEPSDEIVQIRRSASIVNSRYAKGGPVVVGNKPYYYTYETCAPAIAFPNVDDSRLVNFMEKYGADYILLTDSELAFWRPAWAKGNRPPEFGQVARVDGATLFRRRQAE